MKLPNSQNALVQTAKLEHYLLSELHPVGKAKALFFKGLGYDDKDTNILAQDLIAIAQEEEVSEIQSSPFGMKYVIEGMIQTPSGTTVTLRTVWMIERDNSQPRLVTAYPA